MPGGDKSSSIRSREPFDGIGGMLLMLFVLSLAANLLFGYFMGYRSSVASLDQDELEYWKVGHDLLATGEFPVGRRTPVFPLFLGILQAVLPSPGAVFMAISILSASCAPLLALVVHRVSQNRLAAGLAGIGQALWPTSLFFGTSVYSETLALVLFLVFLLVLPRVTAGATIPFRQTLLAGAMLGLCALTRPMYQLFLPIAGLILWLDHRSLIRALKAFAMIVAGFTVAVLPWSVFASIKSGHPMLLSANGGETLAGGFNSVLINSRLPDLHLEKRVSTVGPGKWIPAYKTGYLTPKDSGLDYFAQDKLLRAKALAWMQANPANTAYLVGRKLSYMWGYYPWDAGQGLKNVFGNLSIIGLQLLFAGALFSNRDIRLYQARFYLLPLFVTGVAVISWGSWRFRQPADSGMIAVVALAMAGWYAQYQRQGLSRQPTEPAP